MTVKGSDGSLGICKGKARVARFRVFDMDSRRAIRNINCLRELDSDSAAGLKPPRQGDLSQNGYGIQKFNM